MNRVSPWDVRMRGFKSRTDLADALALLDRWTARLPAESVPVAESAGRVLAGDVASTVNVPAFARAAFDGYAVRAEETFGAGPYNPLRFRVVGVALPGRPFGGVVGPGECVRIMTGAPLPAGADAVLPAEVAAEADGTMDAADAVPPGKHVGRVGEDVAAGRVVLPAGRRLRPQDAGLLAAIGVHDAAAVRRPRVEIVVTGDELLPAGSTPEGHRIVDSNSPMLAALVGATAAFSTASAICPTTPHSSAPRWRRRRPTWC